VQETDENKPQESTRSTLVVIIIIASVLLWVVLRAYTSNGLKSYNDCYLRNDNSVSSVLSGNADYCYKKRPPDILIWITGSK